MILDELDRYLYEFNYKKQLELKIPCCFDELLEMFIKASDPEKEQILSVLEPGTRKDLQEMIDGGLLWF